MEIQYYITNQRLQDFCIEVKEDLKKRLKSAGHVKTGHLLNSISINYKQTNIGFELDFGGLDYLKYLERGSFLEKFILDTNIKFKSILSDSIKKDIINSIKSSI